MKVGRRHRGGYGAGRHRAPRARVAVVASLFAALLVSTAGGCGESEGSPTSSLSTVSTGDVSTVTDTSSGGSTDESLSETAGTRREPIPLGERARVGDWEVRIAKATLDATQVVLDENMFNDPPDAESQYVLLAVEATHRGQEPSTFWIDMLYSFVGDEGDTFGMASAVAPDSITNDGETARGDSISGNLVFLVASKQVSGGTLMLEEAFSWDKGRIFFAVE